MCPLGKANDSSRPIVRSTTGLPNVVTSPVSPGPATASSAARGLRARRHRQRERPGRDRDDRRRAEHGHRPGQAVPRRGQCVDRTVEVAVHAPRRALARVPHGQYREDRGREHDDGGRHPA